MVTRIVKLTLKPENINDFLLIFKDVKETIASFDGCHHVELLQDIQEPHIFFTYSIWEDEHYLNHYRFSEFFKITWQRSKKLFSQKAEAWSVALIERAQSDHF
ncbi:MAG: antibiotic biosynthesis monooxygenase [Chitinophagales bacterium]|jgi:quinol monooxygenase YgiN|nr:antibiotic biosynthesis monooxygenase [Chitinophagales bacterium]